MYGPHSVSGTSSLQGATLGLERADLEDIGGQAIGAASISSKSSWKHKRLLLAHVGE